MKTLFYKKREKNYKSKMFYYIQACMELKRDFCLVPRDMRRAYGELNSPIYEPCCLRSRMIKYPLGGTMSRLLERRRIRRTKCNQMKEHNGTIHTSGDAVHLEERSDTDLSFKRIVIGC